MIQVLILVAVAIIAILYSFVTGTDDKAHKDYLNSFKQKPTKLSGKFVAWTAKMNAEYNTGIKADMRDTFSYVDGKRKKIYSGLFGILVSEDTVEKNSNVCEFEGIFQSEDQRIEISLTDTLWMYDKNIIKQAIRKHQQEIDAEVWVDSENKYLVYSFLGKNDVYNLTK